MTSLMLNLLSSRVLATFFVIMFLSRCSFTQTIDPYFDSIIKEFIEDAERYGVEVDPRILSRMEFGSINGRLTLRGWQQAVGVCLPFWIPKTGLRVNLPRTSRVVISPTYPYGSLQEKALIYHELAHCLLYKDHEDSNSIMSPYMHYECFYRDNWEALIEELFTGKRTLKILRHCFY